MECGRCTATQNLESKYFTKFFKPIPASSLPATHEVKQCPLSRTFWHCTQCKMLDHSLRGTAVWKVQSSLIIYLLIPVPSHYRPSNNYGHPWPPKMCPGYRDGRAGCPHFRGQTIHIYMELQLGVGQVSRLGRCPHFRGVL